jgi:HlyD family secretion protein
MSAPGWMKDAGYSLRDLLTGRWRRLDRWIDARFDDDFAGKDDSVAHGFKPDAVAIEEAPVPVSANAALYTVIALLLIAILWAVFGSVDRIVVAPGKIATRTPLIVMQPFTTSRISNIAVVPGDHVRKGQVLVSFDPAFAQADVASLRHKVERTTAQIARLEAQLGGARFVPEAGAEWATQAQIFAQESAAYAAEMAQRDSRMRGLESQLRAQRDALASLTQQREMSYKVVDIYRRLADQKAGAPLDVMRAQSNALEVDTKVTGTTGDIRRLEEQHAELAAERRAYLDKWRSDHSQQLVQARQEFAEASETLNKAQRLREFTQLRAPADGTILEIADRSVGSVLREAETLLTLVPDGANLYVEANVPSRDISYVKVGDEVQVKLEAYPFQRQGTLNGRLDVLSADSIQLKEGDQTRLVYRAQVRLTDSPRAIAARGFRVRPGLVATAEIKTGDRSIAEYVLDPMLRTAHEGMREP